MNGRRDQAGVGHQSDAPIDLAGLDAVLGPRGEVPAGPDVSEAFSSLTEELDAERGIAAKLRGLPTSARLGVALALGGLWPTFVVLFTARADLGVFPVARMLLELGLMTTAAVTLISLALRPLYRPALPRWLGVVGVIVGVASVAIIATLPAAHALHPASLAGAGADLTRRAVGCFGFGTAFAVVSLVGLAALHRGPQRVPGMLAAAAGAVVGSLALYLHCPITHAVHLWLGHVTVFAPVVVFALVLRR